MAQAQSIPQVSSPFIFQDHQIRTIVQNDQPWFVAADVCKALDIGWTGHALGAIPEDWQRLVKNTNLSKQRVKIINEPAVYKLAFRSNKPQADEFTNWIAGEVIPAIRKTGKYDIQEQPALEASDRLSKVSDPERKALNKLVKVWANMSGADLDPGVWPRINTQVAAHFFKTTVDEMTVREVKEACVWVQSKIDALPKALPEAPQVALPVLSDKEKTDLFMMQRFKEIFDLHWHEMRKASEQVVNRVNAPLLGNENDFAKHIKRILDRAEFSLLVSCQCFEYSLEMAVEAKRLNLC